ncbi:hypothetical protein ARMGADRAFT_1070678 [Armillaria gallica]|uniref:Aminoglycoside phosphotransferase domain-containing protein n=1 Tax=Armillaria gallica TaxID=47427 RepID=A0A2H3F0U4_ARMGA|nr:hypothetical protein ARMGADRAFT_1070678 [Armillaria gallica]
MEAGTRLMLAGIRSGHRPFLHLRPSLWGLDDGPFNDTEPSSRRIKVPERIALRSMSSLAMNTLYSPSDRWPYTDAEPKSPLRKIGSLYFKVDVSPKLQDRLLYLSNKDNQRPSAQTYQIGRIVSREWWRGVRRNIQADRGPRPSYIITAAWLAQGSLSLGIDTNPSFACSDVHRLLEICIAVAHHLAPPNSTLSSPLLAHPDMKASNMRIESPEKPSITCFLRWQGAILDLKGSLPSLPKDIDQLLSDEQEYLRHKSLLRYRFYLTQLPKLVPIHTPAWRYPIRIITISDSWSEFSTLSCPVDLPPTVIGWAFDDSFDEEDEELDDRDHAELVEILSRELEGLTWF